MSLMDKLFDLGDQVFYNWEKKQYPNGDSPFSDQDREMFVNGFAQGYKFLNTTAEDANA